MSVRGRLRASNSEAVRRAALDGQDIGLLSHLLVAEDIKAGRLQVVMPAFRPARFPLTVVYPSRRNLPPPIRAVIEFLSQVIQADSAIEGRQRTCGWPHTAKYPARIDGRLRRFGS